MIEEERKGAIHVVTLNRPEALNALSAPLMASLTGAVAAADADDEVRVIIIAGGERAFAAGADIAQMAEETPIGMLKSGYLDGWAAIRSAKKPIIAAVAGYALGGGAELALSCDLIVASESARFGQPEIKIGVIPGAGGTQLMTRAIGPKRAMELILTGRTMDAWEAKAVGLVNRVVPDGLCLEEALRIAREIAAMPPRAIELAKQAVQRAAWGGLDFELERKNFLLLFSTEDQKEGMAAFLEKRPPFFKGV